VRTLSLPKNLGYFGSGSRPEYARLSEAVWREAGHAESAQIRFFAGGTTAEWDVGASPLRHLAYRLAGQERAVQIVLPKNAIESADDTDLQLLASLADHPRISVLAVYELPTANGGVMLAEVGGKERYMRWACDDFAATAFGLSWGITSNPLIRAAAPSPLTLAGQPIDASALRPSEAAAGDKELLIHHELDGSLQGFGQRFWALIADQHAATRTLFSKQNKDVVRIRYQDSYLFTPLSIALLAELIVGLRNQVGYERWANPTVTIATTRQRGSAENMTRSVVWADWPNMDMRDQVVKHAFDCLGINVQLRVAEKSATRHGRLLEVNFGGGTRLSLRLDQGVSYWRAVTSAQGDQSPWRFDFGLDPKTQGSFVAEMNAQVEGAIHPTEIFGKVR